MHFIILPLLFSTNFHEVRKDLLPLSATRPTQLNLNEIGQYMAN